MFETVLSFNWPDGRTVLIEEGDSEEIFVTTIGKGFKFYREPLEFIVIDDNRLSMTFKNNNVLVVGGWSQMIDWRKVHGNAPQLD